MELLAVILVLYVISVVMTLVLLKMNSASVSPILIFTPLTNLIICRRLIDHRHSQRPEGVESSYPGETPQHELDRDAARNSAMKPPI
jgi:hypothetical protein